MTQETEERGLTADEQRHELKAGNPKRPIRYVSPEYLQLIEATTSRAATSADRALWWASVAIASAATSVILFIAWLIFR